jgi:hypothetical protein
MNTNMAETQQGTNLILCPEIEDKLNELLRQIHDLEGEAKNKGFEVLDQDWDTWYSPDRLVVVKYNED